MSSTKDIQKARKVARATYDFSVSGGAVSTIAIPGSDLLPSGAIVTAVIVDVLTTVTSGGSATIALTAGGVTLVSATAIASVTGTYKATLASSATAIKASSTAGIAAVIATAALTAGKFDVIIEYTV